MFQKALFSVNQDPRIQTKDPVMTLAANPESVLQGIDICHKLSANNQSLFSESHFHQIIIKHLHGSHAVNWRSFSPPLNLCTDIMAVQKWLAHIQTATAAATNSLAAKLCLHVPLDFLEVSN